MMRAEHRRLPFSIGVDKNAAYPEAFSASQEDRIVPQATFVASLFGIAA
jgi:hypothetical protein